MERKHEDHLHYIPHILRDRYPASNKIDQNGKVRMVEIVENL